MKGVNVRLLFGPKDSVAKLKVRGPSGDVRDVELVRSLSLTDPKLMNIFDRTTPVIQVLPSGYGYVDLDRLQAGEVDKMFETIKGHACGNFRHAWLSKRHRLVHRAAFD